MTAKQKQIAVIFPTLKGQEVEVWINHQNDTPFLTGTVDRFTGLYLILKDAKLWNGTTFGEKDVNVGNINKIIPIKKP